MADINLQGLSQADLQAISSGDMSKVSDLGLKIIQQRTAAPVNYYPQDDPGVLGALTIGAGRTYDRVAKGMQQLYYGARSMAHQPTTADLVTGNNEWDRKAAALASNAAEDDKAYSALKDIHPYATGVGEALPSAVIPVGGGASLGANMARMAVAGAVPKALEYGSAVDRGRGALWGAVTGAAVPAVVSGLKVVKGAVEPFYQQGQDAILSRLLNRVAGEDAGNVTAKLANASELVPGSLPTAAQVAENGGISALERATTQANPTPYTQRAMQQASARLGALSGIAKDATALQAAQDARTAATKPLYDAAFSKSAPLTPELQGTLDRLTPDVMSRAGRVAKLETGGPLDVGLRNPGTPANTLLNIPAQPPTVPGNVLHYLKLGVDDAMSAGPQVGMGSVEQGLLGDVKGSLVKQIDQAIPEYGAARNTYAAMSKPINQMQIGQELYNKVAPALRDYGGLTGENAATYARALRDAEGTAQAATGLKNATLSDVMSPEQMATLENIAKDLARKSNAENLGKGVGSNTFQNLSMGNIAAQSGLPGMEGLLTKFPIFSHVGKWAYGQADEAMQGKLANALLDPKAAAGLLAKTQPKVLAQYPVLRKTLEQSAMRAGLLASPVVNNATPNTP